MSSWFQIQISYDPSGNKDELRLLMNEVNNPPLVTFGGQDSAAGKWPNVKGLPTNVHLLTLEPVDHDKTYLIRLEHIFDHGDSDEWSRPAQIKLEEFIGSMELGNSIGWIRETTLGGNVREEHTSKVHYRVGKLAFSLPCTVRAPL